MEIRKEILDILTKDAKIANRHIAAMLGIEEAKVAEEIKAMEDEGIILRYSAVLNTEVMGDLAPAEAFIELKVSPERDFGYNDIARRVYKFPEVTADLIVKVEAKTMKAISQFVWEKLSVLEGVTSTETLFIMRKYKENGEILVEDEKEERLVVTP